jgi:hypothetical protein
MFVIYGTLGLTHYPWRIFKIIRFGKEVGGMCGLHVSLVICHTFLLNFGRDSYVYRVYFIMAWQTFPPYTPIYLMSCVCVVCTNVHGDMREFSHGILYDSFESIFTTLVSLLKNLLKEWIIWILNLLRLAWDFFSIEIWGSLFDRFLTSRKLWL